MPLLFPYISQTSNKPLFLTFQRFTTTATQSRNTDLHFKKFQLKF